MDIANAETESAETSMKGPVLPRDEYGAVDYDSIPDVIQWFLDYDQRVAVIKHPKVEELLEGLFVIFGVLLQHLFKPAEVVMRDRSVVVFRIEKMCCDMNISKLLLMTP